jgi:hypothetical protein
MTKKSVIKPPEELIGIDEAARRMGVSREAVYDYAKRGLITLHKRSIGRPRTFVDWRELEPLLKPRKAGPKGGAVQIGRREYQRRLQRALRLTKQLDAVIEAGTRRSVEATEDIHALREERGSN